MYAVNPASVWVHGCVSVFFLTWCNTSTVIILAWLTRYRFGRLLRRMYLAVDLKTEDAVPSLYYQ